MNSIQFIDAVKHRHHLKNYKEVAAMLNCAEARVSQIRTGKRKIDDGLAIRVAKSLDFPVTYVMASIQAERAKRSEVRMIWANLARTVKIANSMILLGLIGFGSLSVRAIADSAVYGYCILCKVRSRIQMRARYSVLYKKPLRMLVHTLPIAVIALAGLSACATSGAEQSAPERPYKAIERAPGHSVQLRRVSRCQGN